MSGNANLDYIPDHHPQQLLADFCKSWKKHRLCVMIVSALTPDAAPHHCCDMTFNACFLCKKCWVYKLKRPTVVTGGTTLHQHPDALSTPSMMVWVLTQHKQADLSFNRGFSCTVITSSVQLLFLVHVDAFKQSVHLLGIQHILTHLQLQLLLPSSAGLCRVA